MAGALKMSSSTVTVQQRVNCMQSQKPLLITIIPVRHRITLSFPFCILRATRWYFYTTTVGVDSAYIISCSDNTGVGLANAFQYIFINEHQH